MLIMFLVTNAFCSWIKAKVYNTSRSLENSGDLILTAVQRVRQIGSFAKIDATVALAKEVLQDQPAVVIFTSFVTVAKIVHKQLSESGWEGELLTGETPQKKRQEMVDNFQVRKMTRWLNHLECYSPNMWIALALIVIGGTLSCIYIDLWCWRCWIDLDRSAYNYSVGQTVDTRRGSAG